MAGWRDLKRGMRRDVHREMCVPALYLHATGATPWPLTIRGPHNKRPLSVGDLQGGGEGWAEREDTQPRLIFMRDELPPGFRVNAIISVEAGEAYRIGQVLEPDDLIQAAEVVPLSAAEADGLPLPPVPA